jgi:cytochrome b
VTEHHLCCNAKSEIDLEQAAGVIIVAHKRFNACFRVAFFMPQTNKTVRIWDLPTRLFHVALALCVTGAIVAVKLGGLWMDWHVRLGIASLALVTFRIIWGLIGPRYARFAQFYTSPLKTWAYFRAPTKSAGHNPLGAWSVFGMLAIIGWQGTSGLFANDDILTQGPFANMVSSAWSDRLTGLHQFNEFFLYAAIGLHVSAIAFYAYKGQRLIMPMVHGDVQADAVPQGTAPAQDDWRVRAGAALLALTLGTLAWWLIGLAFNAS